MKKATCSEKQGSPSHRQLNKAPIKNACVLAHLLYVEVLLWTA